MLVTVSGRLALTSDNGLYLTEHGWLAPDQVTRDMRLVVMVTPKMMDDGTEWGPDDHYPILDETKLGEVAAYEVALEAIQGRLEVKTDEQKKRFVELVNQEKAKIREEYANFKLPLMTTDTRAPIIARLVGYLGYSNALPCVASDMALFNKDLETLKLTEKQLRRIMIAICCKSRCDIPYWVENGTRDVQKEFIAGLMGRFYPPVVNMEKIEGISITVRDKRFRDWISSTLSQLSVKNKAYDEGLLVIDDMPMFCAKIGFRYNEAAVANLYTYVERLRVPEGRRPPLKEWREKVTYSDGALLVPVLLEPSTF